MSAAHELLRILQELHPEADFLAPGGLVGGGVLDSFDVIAIVGEIHERLGVALPPEEIVPENFDSYARLLALVSGLLEEDGQ